MRYLLVILNLTLILLLVSCGGVSEQTVQTCKQLSDQLDLDENEYESCLRDEELRSELSRVGISKKAVEEASSFNAKRVLLDMPEKRQRYYKSLKGVASIIDVHEYPQKAIKVRGRKYRFPGWIGLQTVTDPKADPFVYLYDLKERDKSGAIIWRLAHLHQLQKEQQRYLMQNCAADDSQDNLGFCVGDLYVAVQLQPGSKTMLTIELHGANFREVDSKRLADHYLTRAAAKP
jgi:hypothetical protein